MLAKLLRKGKENLTEEERRQFQGFTDYPSLPMGGGNPYYACSYCGVTDPQINGDLLNHKESCAYRKGNLNNLFLTADKTTDRTEDLNALFDVLSEYGESDIRLGQAISNAMSGIRTPLFAIENDDLLKLLKKKL